MIPEAFISHCIAGRIRVRVPSMRGDDEYFHRVEEGLNAIPAVKDLRANTLTGSVLIMHAGLEPQALQAHAQDAGLFQLNTSEPEFELLVDRAVAGARRLDSQLRRFSQGSLDLPSGLIVVLVAMGIVQLMRGQVMAPAASLLWYAYDLMSVRR